MADALHFPKKLDLEEEEKHPFFMWLELVDPETGQTIEDACCAYDADEGWMDIMRLNPRRIDREYRQFRVQLMDTAPQAAVEWFSKPLTDPARTDAYRPN